MRMGETVVKWFSLGYIALVTFLYLLICFDKNTYAGERLAEKTMLIIAATIPFVTVWAVYLFWRYVR